jgi:Flp pilus assembly protein TadG
VPERGLSQLSRYLLHHSLRFARDVRGGIMITFALVFPVMLLGIGASIDFGLLYSKRTALQAAADKGALTGASELKLVNRKKSDVKAIAKSTIIANLKDMPGNVDISIHVSHNPASVTVELKQSPGLYFMDTLMGNKDTVIGASATARVAGETPICMLILEEKKKAALKVNKAARITGNKCAVFSNSVSSSGISVHKAGELTAELICSAGGATGGSKSYNPGVLTDCPAMEDPLYLRSAPVVGSCKENGKKIGKINVKENVTLQPGTYCGGLSIGGSANVTLNAGVYVMKDGPLTISGKATIRGEYVGFYLTGKGADFSMGPNTTIELSAPKEGDMTGILFFEDRTASKMQNHTIRSNAARSLVGTFYLPRGSLTIDANKPLFDTSAYTIIIARELNMFSGPDLILNSDYSDSDIPIPPEIEFAPSPGDHIVLVK